MPSSLNNKQQARLLARAVAALMNRAGVREVRLPEDELRDLPDLGMVYDKETNELIFALGDDE